jgi:hypothetical protein
LHLTGVSGVLVLLVFVCARTHITQQLQDLQPALDPVEISGCLASARRLIIKINDSENHSQ